MSAKFLKIDVVAAVVVLTTAWGGVAHGASGVAGVAALMAEVSLVDTQALAAVTDTNRYQSLEYNRTNAPFLNRFHDWAFVRMQRPVNYVDAVFADGLEAHEYVCYSRFRLGLYFENRYRDGFELVVDPKFRADLNMPNMERRLKLVIENSELGRLPGENMAAQDNDLRIGLRRIWDKYEGGVGVKARWPPIAYAQLRWRPKWRWGALQFRPEERIFYESDDGFGSVASMRVYRWLGQAWYAGVSSSGRIAERTNGLEWEQSLVFAYVHAFIEDWEEASSFSDRRTSSCMGLRTSVFGHNDGRDIVDRYRVTLLTRTPIYQDWLYLQVDPEVEWRNEDDWQETYVLRVGLDMLFWGFCEGARGDAP